MTVTITPEFRNSGTVTITISAGAGARTPFWRRFRLPPLDRRTLPLIFIVLLLSTVLLLASRRYAPMQGVSTYAAGCILLLGIAVGGVSCGGGSDPAASGGGTTPSLSLTCYLGSATVATPYTGIAPPMAGRAR